MATKAEIVAELKTYPAYNDIKETVLMRELKASLEKRLADVKGVSTEELKAEEKAAPKKKTTRKTTTKKSKIDFGDSDLDMDLLNDDSIVNDFYGDDFEEVDENDFPF
jgi:hypothetical protein